MYGNGTTFTNPSQGYFSGDFIYANTETRRIISVANDTFMTVDAAFNSTATTLSHQKKFPSGVPIDFGGNPYRSIVIANTTFANLSLSETVNGTISTSVYFDVLRQGTTQIHKGIHKGTNIIIQANTNPGGATGPWCLGIPDVFKLNHVYVGTTANPTNPDKVASFNVDSGQKDSYYGLAYLTSNIPIDPNAVLLVSVDNFTFNETAGGHGYFTAASYPIDDANTANTDAIQTYQIPVYNSKTTNISVDLRDVVDFRPYANATANAVASSNTTATVNPSSTLAFYTPTQGSYMPTPASYFTTNLQHYMPRQDLVSLSTTGEIIVTEGKASNNPVPPAELPAAMTLGYVNIAPYPSLAPVDAKAYRRYDYAVQTTTKQIRRYTMQDIGKIDNRISRIEYYTALSQLEQKTSSMLVRSSTTGQNRFQNGILVDPFNDFSVSNMKNPSYRISIDSVNSEARPYFSTISVKMYPDFNMSTNIVQSGNKTMLNYQSSVIASQMFATAPVVVTTPNTIITPVITPPKTYGGTIYLDPNGDTTPDYSEWVISHTVSAKGFSDSEDIVQYISTAWGTNYGNWTNQNIAITNTNINAINTNNPQTSNTSLVKLYDPTASMDAGTTYTRARFVIFEGHGFKANTILNAYFDGANVSYSCIPLTPYSGTYTTSYKQFQEHSVAPVQIAANGAPICADSSGKMFTYNIPNYANSGWNQTLKTDANGSVYGIFSIKNRTFRSANLAFVLRDGSSQNSYTTYGSAIYYGAKYQNIANGNYQTRIDEPVVTNITSAASINNSNSILTTTTNITTLGSDISANIPAVSADAYSFPILPGPPSLANNVVGNTAIFAATANTRSSSSSVKSKIATILSSVVFTTVSTSHSAVSFDGSNFGGLSASSNSDISGQANTISQDTSLVSTLIGQPL